MTKSNDISSQGYIHNDVSISSHPFLIGIIITHRDIATKQLIVFLNQENDGKIILKDLVSILMSPNFNLIVKMNQDDTHVLIDERYYDHVNKEVAKMLEQNVYERDTSGKK